VSGSVPIPEATQFVDAAYCYPAGCLNGIVDVGQVSRDPDCVGADLNGSQVSVCATRSASDTLHVEGVLQTWGGRDGPPVGEIFSLVLTDHESGAELLDERERSPEYTRFESCSQTCWSAEVTF
jgi:hypothetical protein